MNANMKRLLIFALVPVTVWAIGSTFTKQKIDRIGVNTESQITMEDTTRFSSGTASTVPYLDANKDFVSSSVTPTELGYLSGVTSSIQTQIDSKQTSVSGTANEIDVAADIIGLADNPILPGLESVTIPAGADGDRPSSPVNGMIRYNTTSSSFEGYQAGAWGELGGGGGVGGSRLQLISDPSFEEGVTEGSCTGCTATQDTTDKLGTDNNLASLKMAFSASSGDYTLTKSTSAQYSNVAGVVSAWIKTSASDCHFDELVDGTQSQTVAIGSSDEWKQYIINGTTGTTSYGWRVRCDTAITDDVFVDETFAGAAEPDVFDIGTASFFGSVKWGTTTNCVWLNSSAGSHSNFSADVDCDDNARVIKGEYNTTNGDVGNSDGQTPKISFSSLPAGTYKIEAKGLFYTSFTQASCNWRFSDGTTGTVGNVSYDSANSEGGFGNIIGEFHYDSTQGAKTFQIQSYPETSATNCGIYANSDARELEISVYHYPAPQKVVAAKCDGLECINDFNAYVDSSGNVTNENVDWINGNAAVTDTSLYTITYNSGVFTSSLNCRTSRVTPPVASIDIATLTSSTTSTAVVRTGFSTTGTSFTKQAGDFFIECSRQGSDYKQFDQRFIPVVDEFNTEWTEYTPVEYNAGTATWSTLAGWWRRDGQDMLIRISAIASGAGSGSGVVGFSIPSGYVTDPGLSQNFNSGRAYTYSVVSNAVDYEVASIYDSSFTTPSIKLSKQNASTFVIGTDIRNGSQIYIDVRVPIAGWSTGKTAFIGNLTPKEFVQTPGSTKPVMYSFEFGDASENTNCTASPCTVRKNIGLAVSGVTRTSAGIYTATLNSGKFGSEPSCTCSAFAQGVSAYTQCTAKGTSSTSILIYTAKDDATWTAQDAEVNVICHGVQ